MENYQKLNSLSLFVLTLIALATVFAITKAILVPFTLAVFIALIYSPVIHYFENRFKLPNILVLSVSFIVLIIFFAVITTLIGGSIDSFVHSADQYKDRLNTFAEQLAILGKTLGIGIESQDIQSLLQKFPVMTFIKQFTGSMLSLLSNTFLVVVFSLFLLTGESQSKRNLPILEEIKINAGKYISTKLLTSGLTAIISFIILKSFSVEMAFMFALLTFMLNFIPNIGSIIAVALPLPIVFIQYGIGAPFIAVLILCLATQLIIGNILEPKLMGESMGLHPVTILFFLTFWGFIWGIPGMFLSVPITATLKIIFSKFSITKPISKLFSGDLSGFNL